VIHHLDIPLRLARCLNRSIVHRSEGEISMPDAVTEVAFRIVKERFGS